MTLFITKQISSDLIAYYVMSVQANEYKKRQHAIATIYRLWQ